MNTLHVLAMPYDLMVYQELRNRSVQQAARGLLSLAGSCAEPAPSLRKQLFRVQYCRSCLRPIRLGLGAVAAIGGAKAGKKAWDTLRQVGHGHGAQQVSGPS